jgi:hypothetical protein
VAEGGGLLNRYTLQRRIEGSNPSVSATANPLKILGTTQGLIGSFRHRPLSRVWSPSRPAGRGSGCTFFGVGAVGGFARLVQ